jgi:hypothetical protein
MDLGLPDVLEPCPLCLLKQDPEKEKGPLTYHDQGVLQPHPTAK